MSASKKELRQPPPCDFEKYTLAKTYVPGSGLMRVSNDLFRSCGKPDGSWLDPIDYQEESYVSNAIDIGFNFIFDNVTYNKLIVSKDGWIVLLDPNVNSFSLSDIFALGMPYNWDIRCGAGVPDESNSVLLAPWLTDLRTMAKEAFDNNLFSNIKKFRIYHGLENLPANINANYAGVRYCNNQNSIDGKYIVIRWGVNNKASSNVEPLLFDVVLYENGKIEFRYENRGTLNLSEKKYIINHAVGNGSTVGIFHSRKPYYFRDFSYELGYKSNERARSKFGGAEYDTNFFEVVNGYVYYGISLTTYEHWPAREKEGCVLTFSPPVNTYRPLPRPELRSRDSQISLPITQQSPSRFNDNRTIPYTNTLVNAVSRLSRLHGNSGDGDIVQRQGLFSNDIEITAPTLKTSDEFLSLAPKTQLAPFFEHNRPDNTPNASINPFYTTGTPPLVAGEGFNQPLRSKTHIKLTLPVNHNCVMLPTSSVMYYYNSKTGGWNVPTNSNYMTDDSGNPTGPVKSDIIFDHYNDGDVKYYRSLEDHIGFGPVGNFVASGSTNKGTTNSKQSDPDINSFFSKNKVNQAVSHRYDKSITVNQNYNATSNETFTLPIKQPFLLEKAVIEIPIAVGQGWFNDKTQPVLPGGGYSESYDFGGPGVTVALHNQISLGSNKVRDIIFSGSFTHYQDTLSSIEIDDNWGYASASGTEFMFALQRQVGFIANGGSPAGIINNSTNYTGSVVLECKPAIANGAMVSVIYDTRSDDADTNRLAAFVFLNTKTIVLDQLIADVGAGAGPRFRIPYISPLCRSKDGTSQSGRSVFGGEFELENSDDVAASPNPFYTGQSSVSGDAFAFFLSKSYIKHKISPYLIKPGDNLILSISKTRPAINALKDISNQIIEPYTYNKLKHDIQLITGSVNITLYGSYVQDGHEYHEPLKQPLSSDAIHEIVIGNEPVLDQFDTEYAGCYEGGYVDDVVMGDLVRKKTNPDGTQGVEIPTRQIGGITYSGRGRVFSKLKPLSSQFSPGAGPYDYSGFTSRRIRSHYKKSGFLTSTFVDESERYYDSMMPGISDILTALNAKKSALAYRFAPVGWNPNSYKGGGLDPTFLTQLYVEDKVLFFPTKYFGKYRYMFPFEPRFSGLRRQVSLEKSALVDGYYDASDGIKGSGTWIDFAERYANKFLIEDEISWTDYATNKLVNNSAYPEVLIDSSGEFGTLVIPGTYDRMTWLKQNFGSGMFLDDASKMLYGLGDRTDYRITVSVPDDPGTVTGLVGPLGIATVNPSGVANSHFGTDLVNGLVNFVPVYIVDDIPDSLPIQYRVLFAGSTAISPIIRCWRYGVYSGLPSYSRAHFRKDRYGQFRDLLEQRPFTVFHDAKLSSVSLNESPVAVRFVDSVTKVVVSPSQTWSQNLSTAATSSLPYFDGEVRNRFDTPTNETLGSVFV